MDNGRGREEIIYTNSFIIESRLGFSSPLLGEWPNLIFVSCSVTILFFVLEINNIFYFKLAD